ncbi:FAD-dependent 5-carboxymethylaminomethyl-2-thiouridine(34) oxidoreductase MnmC [Collimonas sp.]|jgi:tRNA 5-methylaminomethyl-2-thiouridine biosynthesis bifunctional protein|uniref:FAD-dependent 5-carboxymethylaminomethyl-2-thiouridine(34) oxidoreductase MnmC n=1 Tax=Collimonas sp. TaxID=1963772 RepID=UPI0037C0CB2D
MSSSHNPTTLPNYRRLWNGRQRFVLFDSEFGDGTDFLSAWQAWRDDPQRPQQLHYLALAPDMPTVEEVQITCSREPAWQALSTELCRLWPVALPGFHRLLLEREQVVLTLMCGDSSACLRQIAASVDAFHIHGRHWQGWALPTLGALGKLAGAGASLSLPATDQARRKRLEQVGFAFGSDTVDAAGADGMLHARFAPRFSPRQRLAGARPQGERHAIVIGAGLAGSAACQRLARRGWRLTLVESHAAPAQEASGNSAGIFMPLLSRDDNPSSRLSRNAYLFAQQVWRHLGGIGQGFEGSDCGVLQIARDDVHAEAQRQLAAHWRYPAEFAEWLEQPAASDLAGCRVSGGGWYFRGAGWIQPGSLCHAMLRDCGTALQSRFGQPAASIARINDAWLIRDSNGVTIASAPVVILANACGALNFTQARALPLTAIRGQISHLDAASAPAIAPVLCGAAYLTPACAGICSSGASYDEDQQTTLRQASQDDNLTRLARMLPDWRHDNLLLRGRVGFRCVASDRLPLVGALPDSSAACQVREPKLHDLPRFPGLYSLLGYASRGLIWAPLAAEILAAQLDGEPLPLEADLAAALDPARFLRKQHRAG